MSEALVARWDGFLKNIKDRFDQIMQESKDGCAQMLVETNYDPIPMGNAWGAMERRAKDLSTKIEETWNQQVEPKFEEAGVARPAIDEQRRKGDAMRDFIEMETERTRIMIYCKLARDVRELDARESQANGGGYPCKSCGAPLVVPHTFRVVNLTCAHCRTVNEYEPGTRTRYVEASCLHSLCQEAAWNELVAMHQAERQFHATRPPRALAQIQAWEQAQIAYHRKYLTARLQYLPDQAPSFGKDLAGRMEHFYVYGINGEVSWINAGRPRAQL